MRCQFGFRVKSLAVIIQADTQIGNDIISTWINSGFPSTKPCGQTRLIFDLSSFMAMYGLY